MDWWDVGDDFIVKVDGREVWRLEAGRIRIRQRLCGWAPDIGLVVAEIVVAHTREAAVVELTSSSDETSWDESWGVAGAEFSVE